MKKLTFYYLPLCPRSYLSLINIKKVIGQSEDYKLEIIKTFTLKKNYRRLYPPVIEFDNRFLSEFILTRSRLKSFLGL